MKKTIIVNINGIIFNIDEDAYAKLEVYLETLKHYFSSNPEGDEIIADIEGRIVELLQPKISAAKQSISFDDVNEMIEILGKPEDIAGAGDEPFSKETSGTKENAYKSSSRLYRDPDHAILGGVCSGLGAYFNLDPVFFRIVFFGLLFAGGVSFIIYPILWIAVPKARTATQKLEMRGENVTVENIERTFREEYEQVKGNVSRMRYSSAWDKIRNFVNEFTSLLMSLFRVVWNVFRYILGVVFIIFSMVMIISMISTFYFTTFFMHGLWIDNFASLQDFLHHLINPVNADLLLILAIIGTILPLAGLIYAGLKLIIRFRANDKWIILSLFLVWIFSVIIFITMIFNEADRFKKENRTKENVTLVHPKSNVLYINMFSFPEIDKDQIMKLSHSNFFSLGADGSNKFLYGIISINVEKSLTTNAELEIEKEARGATSDEALSATKSFSITYNQTDSILNINPSYRIDNEQLWKFRMAKVTVKVPVGMRVHLNENTKELLDNIDGNNHCWYDTLVNRTWQMTDKGLSKPNEEK